MSDDESTEDPSVSECEFTEPLVDPEDEADPLPARKPVVIIPRAEWGGPPSPADGLEIPHPINSVLFTYTETERCYNIDECKKLMKTVYDKSIANGLNDIPYNFVVGEDGTVYEGRGWHIKPELNTKFTEFNGENMEISHFGETGKAPPPDQLDGSWELLFYGIEKKYILKLPKRHALFF